MSNPLVSIILTVFNNEASIIETLKAMLNQTYQNIEIIIMDNGSFDNSIPLLKNYRKKYSNIRVLSEGCLDFIDAQKLALISSKGKYINFADCGKLMSPYFIEYMVSHLEAENAQIMSCNLFEESVLKIFHEEDIIMESPPEKIEKLTNIQYMEHLYAESEHDYQCCTFLWNKLIDKNFLITSQYIQNKFPLNISYPIISSKPSTVLTTNQYLMCNVLYDKFFLENSFNYEHLETIKFMESLLIKYKNEKNEIAMYNMSIRLLRFLTKVRKQLSFYMLDIFDKEDLQQDTNLKFNSIYKFLVAKYPDKQPEFENYYDAYKNILVLESNYKKAQKLKRKGR